MTDVQEIIIVGHRQHGKTHAALVLAVNEAKRGNTVYYQASRVAVYQEAYKLALEIAPTKKVIRATKSVGNCGIHFKGGGRILFGVADLRGFQIDAHVIDVFNDGMTSGYTQAHPTAKRVVRTFCD